MRSEQLKKWAVSQVNRLIRIPQTPTTSEVNDFENGHSDSNLFKVGPMGVGVLGHPFLGLSYKEE